MRYRVRHHTVYQYSEMVSICHNETHLHPRTTAYQQCLQTEFRVRPTPSVVTPEVDYFGNPIRFFTLQEPHHRMDLTTTSELEILARTHPEPSSTERWDQLVQRMRRERSVGVLAAYEMSFPSPRVHLGSAFADYARSCFPAGRPILEAALDLTRRIHREFTFRPGATSVSTPVQQVLRTRTGVCQDFAHVEIACLRALGVAARYVSGYIQTTPPKGRPRLVGADASHAWVSVWCGEAGWIDLDPTNDVVVSDQHVTVAWGRDYGDVAPIRGVILGGSEHTVEVGVDVEPLSATEAAPREAQRTPA